MEVSEGCRREKIPDAATQETAALIDGSLWNIHTRGLEKRREFVLCWCRCYLAELISVWKWTLDQIDKHMLHGAWLRKGAAWCWLRIGGMCICTSSIPALIASGGARLPRLFVLQVSLQRHALAMDLLGRRPTLSTIPRHARVPKEQLSGRPPVDADARRVYGARCDVWHGNGSGAEVVARRTMLGGYEDAGNASYSLLLAGGAGPTTPCPGWRRRVGGRANQGPELKLWSCRPSST